MSALANVMAAMDDWGGRGIPFLFTFDFELQQPWAMPLADVDPEKIRYRLPGMTKASKTPPALHAHPLPFDNYAEQFKIVHDHVRRGDSYLVNLTVRTPVELQGTLRDVFDSCAAPYVLWVRDQFVVFSPETFVTIADGCIRSCPMKGTIDASLPNAAAQLLADPKELAEHVTIVDLIRNDLSRVSQRVAVTRFRYLDRIAARGKSLLQASSEITGTLDAGYERKLGTLISALLPAGSVSGAPKPRTLEIIREAEGERRGFYTGVFGCFDGHRLDSAVMIRFLEQRGNNYFYRSGGGITAQSRVRAEYDEVLNKIYVPVA